MKTRSMVLEGPGKMVMKEFDIPSIGPDEGLLKVVMTGVCGSDPKFYNAGFNAPLIMGHEIFGHIAEIGKEASRLLLNASCGWDISTEEIKDISIRNYYFNRGISCRHGYHPSQEDFLPPRAFGEPITDKYGTTWVWDHDEFEAARKHYYTRNLGLSENGLLPENEMERLGLGFVILELKSLGAIA